MPLNLVYTSRVETIDLDLDRRSRAISLSGLILATTLGVAGPSFAQSAPQTTGATVAVATPAPTAQTGESVPSADRAAKEAAQNPLANTISVPFQNNTFYDVGPDKGVV